MMNRQEKIMAAAMAAVAAYMQQEQEILDEKIAVAAAPPKPQAFNYWGQHGRQGMMQMRTLMQMRAFPRLR